jgi:predicted TPR repeat methyltransferase
MRFGTTIDLGCGTGLAGAVFRPCVDWLTGVDLSAGMIERARQKGLYDRLVVDDIRRFLAGEDAATCHLLLAADVFVYIADLAPVVAAAARVMAAGSLLAFTVETHAGAGVRLGATLRYAHGADSVRDALAAAGLQVLDLTAAAPRTEKGVPVDGLAVVALRA